MLIFALIGSCLYLLLKGYHTTLVVDHVEWSRSIGIEDYKELTEKGW